MRKNTGKTKNTKPKTKAKAKKKAAVQESEQAEKKTPFLKRLFFGEDKPDLSELESGSTTILDILSPTTVDTKSRDYIIVDGGCYSYLYVAGYGYSTIVGSCWLAPLVEAGEGVNLIFTANRQPREKILSKISQTTMVNRSRMRDVGDTRQDYEELDADIERKSRRNALTSSVAAAFPFASYELSDRNGVFLGLNMYNRSPVFLDPYDDYKYTNGNCWIGGSSGAGKTFTLQCLGGRLRQQGRRVIFIVPKKGHEVRRLCERHSPGVGQYAKKTLLFPLEVSGSVEELGCGWLHITLNTLLPHCRYQTPAWLSDTIRRLLDDYEAGGRTIPTFQRALLVIDEHCGVEGRHIFDQDNKGWKAVSNALKGRVIPDDDQHTLSLALLSTKSESDVCHITLLDLSDAAEFFARRSRDIQREGLYTGDW